MLEVAGTGSTSTDATGAYTARPLPAGTYTVIAYPSEGGSGGVPPRLGRAVRADVTLREGQHLTGIDLELAPGGSVAGSVRAPDGSPAANAIVLAGPWDPVTRHGTYANRRGEFRLDALGVGEVLLSIHSPESHGAATARVRIEQARLARVDVRLLPATTLDVRVIDERDEASAATLTALGAGGPAIRVELGHGHHRVGPLLPGTYTLRIRHESRTLERKVTVDGEPEREVVLRLE